MNRMPKGMSERLKRQSCPARAIGGLSQSMSSKSMCGNSVLGDLTNMTRSVVWNGKEQKESASWKNRYSEPVSLQTTLKKQDAHQQEQLEEKNDYSFGNSYKEQKKWQNIEEENISERSSLSKISQVSSQRSSQSSLSTASSCPKKTVNTVKKLIILGAISLVSFLAVITVKYTLKQTFESDEIYFPQKNKYFEQQLGDGNNSTQKMAPPQYSLAHSNTLELHSESQSNDHSQILSIQNDSDPQTRRSQDYPIITSENKLENLIVEEAEQFYSTLVRVVQVIYHQIFDILMEKQISYSQFEEHLSENCTPDYLEKVKLKIQRLVDDSLSIKEVVNIETGTRNYVSQEKY